MKILDNMEQFVINDKQQKKKTCQSLMKDPSDIISDTGRRTSGLLII